MVCTIYGHGGHLNHVTWQKYIKFLSPFARRPHMKFKEIGPVVSEQKPFENMDRHLTCDLWPKSPNNLDL